MLKSSPSASIAANRLLLQAKKMRQRRPTPITTAYSLIFELLKTEAEYVREIVAFFPTAG